jgi:hypothetical protein
MNQADFGACRVDRAPIVESSSSLEALVVYLQFLRHVRIKNVSFTPVDAHQSSANS